MLSSTSQPALSPLFQVHCDSGSASAFVAVVQDTQCRDESKRVSGTCIIASPTAGALDFDGQLVPIRPSKGCIAGAVVHLQDPSWKRTFIQAGSRKGKGKERLGIELPWLGLHIRPLGKRAWCFDVGLIDARGVEGIIRVSSLAVCEGKTIVAKLTRQDEAKVDLSHEPPIVHLPLELPAEDNALTPWLHLNLHLPTLLSSFKTVESHQSPPNKRQKRSSQHAPTATFGSTSFVRVYANCRVRRIWFSQDGEKTLGALDSDAAGEMGLYAAEMQVE